MTSSTAERLQHVPLFSRCSRKQLEFLASRMDDVDVEAGRTLVHAGQPSDTFFVLLEGEVDVEVDRGPHASLRPGDYFGEISMLDRGPATATVTSKTPARLLVMSHVQFRDAIKADENLLSDVLATMATRLRRDSLARLSAE